VGVSWCAFQNFNTEILFPFQFKLPNGRTTIFFLTFLMPSPRLELRTLASYSAISQIQKLTFYCRLRKLCFKIWV